MEAVCHEMMKEENQNQSNGGGIKSNTIILGMIGLFQAALLAVATWTIGQTVENGKHLASIDAISNERALATIRLEEKLDKLVKDQSSQKDALTEIRLQIIGSKGSK